MKSTYMALSILFLSGIITRADIETQIKEQNEISRIQSKTMTFEKHLSTANVTLANEHVKRVLKYKNEHECRKDCNAEVKWRRVCFETAPDFCLKQRCLFVTALAICEAQQGLAFVNQDLILKLLEKLAVQDTESKTYRGSEHRWFFEHVLPKAVKYSDMHKLDKNVMELAILHAKLKRPEDKPRFIDNL